MKKFNRKKTITAVTGVAVLGVAVTALGNASELETIFNPSKFEKFQNQNKAEEYDYTAGEGDDVDLADKDKNGEDSSKEKEQQALQIPEEQKEEQTPDTLGIVDENQTPDTNPENTKKTGVEFTNTNRNNSTGNNSENRNNTGNNGNSGSSSDNGNKKDTSNKTSGKTDKNSNKGDSGNNAGNNNSNNSGNSDNNSNGNNNGSDNGNNQTPVVPTATPTAVPSPTPTPVPEELKPRDPYVNENGQKLLSLHAEIKKEYYCKGDKFSAEDAVVTATFLNKDGTTETRTLSYGGSDGYKVSISTNLTGTQTAVFTYKGISSRAAYKVLNNTVFLNYMASFDDDDRYYMGAFPGQALEEIFGESGYKVLTRSESVV